MFLEETGGLYDDCPWRGRRGSSLARGHWRSLKPFVLSSGQRSRELQRRLTLTSVPVRQDIVCGFDAMAS